MQRQIANATFDGISWEEAVINEPEGHPKLSRAIVTNRYRGDIEGDSWLEYLMLYPAAGPVPFIGYERIVGRIGDRTGSIVLQAIGTYEDGVARGQLSVVPGSGTGQLAGLQGEGSFVARHGEPAEVRIEYGFE